MVLTREAGITLVASLVIAVSNVQAQVLECTLTRTGPGALQGACVSGDTVFAQIEVMPPASGTTTVWRGKGKLEWRPNEEPLAIDMRNAGSLRTGTAWFDIQELRKGTDTIRFRFDSDKTTAASQVDVMILERVRRHFETSSHWSRSDDSPQMMDIWKGPQCPDSEQRTFLCEVYWASIEVADEFWPGRPLVAALRGAIQSSAEQPYRHPLAQFNSAPNTTLSKVQEVVDAALKAVRGQLATASPR